ncbi:MAG: hypothetical protein U0521_26070 [Anaerolineae bacterium]
MATQTQTKAVRLAVNEEVIVGESLTRVAMRRLRRDRLTQAAAGALLILTLSAIFAPFISTQILHQNHTRTSVTEAFMPPGTDGHILGTDDLGRDHLARLLYAGQVSLGIGFMAALLSLGIGVSLGILTGYFGGIVDDLVNWIIATLTSIPSLFLLLILSAVLTPGPTTLVLSSDCSAGRARCGWCAAKR